MTSIFAVPWGWSQGKKMTAMICLSLDSTMASTSYPSAGRSSLSQFPELCCLYPSRYVVFIPQVISSSFPEVCCLHPSKYVFFVSRVMLSSFPEVCWLHPHRYIVFIPLWYVVLIPQGMLSSFPRDMLHSFPRAMLSPSPKISCLH